MSRLDITSEVTAATVGEYVQDAVVGWSKSNGVYLSGGSPKPITMRQEGPGATGCSSRGEPLVEWRRLDFFAIGTESRSLHAVVKIVSTVSRYIHVSLPRRLLRTGTLASVARPPARFWRRGC